MNWRRWNWLEGGVLPLAIIVFRACWLWLWLALAQQLLLPPPHLHPLLPAWLLIALPLASLLIIRWTAEHSRAGIGARVGTTVLGLAVIFLLLWWQFYRSQYALWQVAWVGDWGREVLFWVGGVPPSYIVLPTLVYLWLSGVWDGGRPLDHIRVQAAFRRGCLALVVALFTFTLTGTALPAGTGNLVILFFAAAMLALSLTGLKTGRAPGRLDRYWLGSAVTVIGGVLGLGLLLSLFIAPATVAQIVNWTWLGLTQLLILLIKIISLILYPILYLLSLLVPLLVWLLSRFPGTDTPEIRRPQPPNSPFTDPSGVVGPLPGEWRWVGLLLFILGIAFLFALALHRRRSNTEEEIEETRELIFSSALLLAQLHHLWPGWLAEGGGRPSPFFSLAGEPDTRRLIRAAYQALLAATRERGQAREPAQTPLEYMDKLAQAVPGASDELAIITVSYNQARYASEPPTPETAEQTELAWQRLSTKLTIHP